MSILMNILIGASGICWSIVYIECIRKGFKEKTYCMPLFALALNIAWEGIYAFTDLFIRHSYGAQAIANTVWFVLDIFIIVTWLKFGIKDFDSNYKKKWFIPWTLIWLQKHLILFEFLQLI